MQPGRQLPVEFRTDDRVVAGAVAGRAGADVVKDVGVGVEELEDVIAPPRDLRDVQHERALGQVQVTERVERVEVRGDESRIVRGCERGVAAELVDRRVAKLVRDGDAGVLLLLA